MTHHSQAGDLSLRVSEISDGAASATSRLRQLCGKSGAWNLPLTITGHSEHNAEAYKGGKYDKRFQRFQELLKRTNLGLLSREGHREILSKAGYTDIQVDEDYEKGWICALGRKPALGS